MHLSLSSSSEDYNSNKSSVIQNKRNHPNSKWGTRKSIVPPDYVVPSKVLEVGISQLDSEGHLMEDSDSTQIKQYSRKKSRGRLKGAKSKR